MLDLTTTNVGPQVVPWITVHGDATVIPPPFINTWSAQISPAYWRALNFIAENLATFPRSVRQDGARRDDETPHPLDKLLKRKPNRYQNATQLWRPWFFNAAHRGNGYLWIERSPRSMKPLAFHNLETDDVEPFRVHDEKTGQVEQFYYVRSRKEALPGADVLHLQTISHDGHEGVDPIALHNATLQRAATLDRYLTMYLANGTMIRKVIEVDPSVSDERIERMQQMLKDHFRGANADRDVLILAGGKMVNSTQSHVQSEITQQAVGITKQISQITGVPPEFLMEFSESKYNNNLEQMGQNVVRYTFRPWIEQAEDEMTMKLLTEAEQDTGLSVRINPDALLRGDTKTQNEIVRENVKAGVVTKNEGRSQIELPPDTGAESDQLNTLGDTAPKAPAAA